MLIRKITDKAIRVRVVDWIRSGAPLKEGVSLYGALSNHDPALLATLKRSPSKYADLLYEDICLMMGITKSKFQSIINEYHGQNSANSKLSNAESQNSSDRRSQRRPPDKDGERHKSSPAKRSFRNEWPFLSRPECPPQLKALAADKISAWERYTEAHKKLYDCSSTEECYQVAHELLENFKENRLIHEELNHYKKHGGILGKHRIWRQYDRFEQLRGLNVFELVKLCEKTLPHRIWRIESEIKKGDKPHLLGEREQRLSETKTELAEVKRILGVNE